MSRASSRHGSPARSRPADPEDWASRLKHPKDMQPLEGESYMISDSGRAIPVGSPLEELEDDGFSSAASVATPSAAQTHASTALASEAGSVAVAHTPRREGEALRDTDSPRHRHRGIGSPRSSLLDDASLSRVSSNEGVLLAVL